MAPATRYLKNSGIDQACAFPIQHVTKFLAKQHLEHTTVVISQGRSHNLDGLAINLAEEITIHRRRADSTVKRALSGLVTTPSISASTTTMDRQVLG